MWWHQLLYSLMCFGIFYKSEKGLKKIALVTITERDCIKANAELAKSDDDGLSTESLTF